ncbi:MAG TPA: FAD-binding oxidoreductase, partial [Acidobacteria bacterium]|nr:FAD-binding oxidoreductase [Acidobacteriota bacterium]
SDWVLGLEAVLADGSVIRTGGACRKDVTGYDLTHLLVGSEGTLGIITEATLRLIPYPPARALLLAAFPELEDGLAGVLSVFRRLTPSVCEYLEAAALEAAARHLDRPLPAAGAGSYVFLEVDGDDEDQVDRQMLAAGEALEAAGAVEILVAQTPRETEELWALRRATGEAVKALSTYKEEDCVVPRARIAELVRGVKEIAGRHGIATICYGHAGDGNIHVNVLRMGASDAVWEQELPRAIEEIFRLTVSLGGTISGEHGIGWSQRRYLPIRMSARELELLRAVKAAFDPKNILNPGKILPDPPPGSSAGR